MKLALYEELRSLLVSEEDSSSSSSAAAKSLQSARARFPDIPFDTLLSIQSQEHSRRLRLTFHRLRNPQSVRQYIAEYVVGEDILAISSRFHAPPCVILRFLLEHLFGLSKQQISLSMKDPCLLPQDCINAARQNYSFPSEEGAEAVPFRISWMRLHHDLYRCMESDPVSSPYVEMIRRVTGIEYEEYLCRRLQVLGIAFQTEDALRAAGFSKTPDVKLEVPMCVRTRLVNWIDSKASFGDDYNHKKQSEEQFQRYVNRFGPGMVIYWFGFIEEVDGHPDILLLDAFPQTSEIYCLPCLNVKLRP